MILVIIFFFFFRKKFEKISGILVLNVYVYMCVYTCILIWMVCICSGYFESNSFVIVANIHKHVRQPAVSYSVTFIQAFTR